MNIGSADLDGDGRGDLVVSGALLGPLYVSLGEADGGFRELAPVPVATEGAGLLLTDLDGDGRPDVVLTNQLSGDVAVLINAGRGAGTVGFGPELRYRGGPGVSSVFESYASIVANALFPGAFPALYFALSAEETHSVAAADFDGDGVPDLVIVNGDARVALLFGGAGGPQVVQTLTATNALLLGAVVLRAGADGLLEVFVIEEGTDVPIPLTFGLGPVGTPVEPAPIEQLEADSRSLGALATTLVALDSAADGFSPAAQFPIIGAGDRPGNPEGTRPESALLTRSASFGGNAQGDAGSSPSGRGTGVQGSGDNIAAQRGEVVEVYVTDPRGADLPGGSENVSGADLVGSLLTGGRPVANLLPTKQGSVAPVAAIVTNDPGEDGRLAPSPDATGDAPWINFVVGLDDTIHRNQPRPLGLAPQAGWGPARGEEWLLAVDQLFQSLLPLPSGAGSPPDRGALEEAIGPPSPGEQISDNTPEEGTSPTFTCLGFVAASTLLAAGLFEVRRRSLPVHPVAKSTRE